MPKSSVKTSKLDGALGVVYKYKNAYFICNKSNFNHYSEIIATDIFYNKNYQLSFPEIENHTFLFEIITIKNPFTVNYVTHDTIFPIGVVNNMSLENDFTFLNSFDKEEVLIPIYEGFVEAYSDGTMIKYKMKNFMEEYQKFKKWRS